MKFDWNLIQFLIFIRVFYDSNLIQISTRSGSLITLGWRLGVAPTRRRGCYSYVIFISKGTLWNLIEFLLENLVIHVLSPNEWIGIVIQFQAFVFLVILIPIPK
jgi:hypothetical protein